APTFPTTPTDTPKRARPVAVFRAQPPPRSVISSTSLTVPRGDRRSTGRAITSATSSPRHTTLGTGPELRHVDLDVVRDSAEDRVVGPSRLQDRAGDVLGDRAVRDEA